MRPRLGETRVSCEPPSRQIAQILRSPGPTAPGPRGIDAFPRRGRGVTARFRPRCGFGSSWPFSLGAPASRLLAAAGNCKHERSATPGFRLDPNSSPQTLDNFLTNRKTDACTWNLAAMQAFKQAEHPVGVLRIDTDSVIPHRKQPPFRYSLCRDMDPRCFLTSVLDRIRNQILEKLHQQDLFGHDGW